MRIVLLILAQGDKQQLSVVSCWLSGKATAANGSLVAEGGDGVELRGFAGWVEAKEDPDTRGEQAGEQEQLRGELDLPLQRGLEQRRGANPGKHSKNTPRP